MTGPPTYDRWAFEKAMWASGLPTNAKVLAAFLASDLPVKNKPQWNKRAGEDARLIETLATATGLSRASVKRAANDLEAAGFLTRTKRANKQGRRSSIFRLHLPAKAHTEPLGKAHTEPLGLAHTEPYIRVSQRSGEAAKAAQSARLSAHRRPDDVPSG